MERDNLEKDVTIFYVTATSFPQGIMDAHKKLHSLLKDDKGRHFYGVSRPENKGAIIYKAGVEELFAGEGKKYGCESMTIKKGKYLSLYISDYNEDPTSISKAFEKILAEHGLDPEGYCVEMYVGENDVKCMVRLED